MKNKPLIFKFPIYGLRIKYLGNWAEVTRVLIIGMDTGQNLGPAGGIFSFHWKQGQSGSELKMGNWSFGFFSSYKEIRKQNMDLAIADCDMSWQKMLSEPKQLFLFIKSKKKIRYFLCISSVWINFFSQVGHVGEINATKISRFFSPAH